MQHAASMAWHELQCILHEKRGVRGCIKPNQPAERMHEGKTATKQDILKSGGSGSKGGP